MPLTFHVAQAHAVRSEFNVITLPAEPCRAAIARAALAYNKGMVRITTASNGQSQVIRAPVAVLRLYSGMLNDMVSDGVIDVGSSSSGGGGGGSGGGSANGSAEADGNAEEVTIAANDRHAPEAVSATLRWAMGLHTLLAADVHTCAQVLWCAVPTSRSICTRVARVSVIVSLFTVWHACQHCVDVLACMLSLPQRQSPDNACSVAHYFQITPLQLEALCVICQKAQPQHLPVLNNLLDTLHLDGLDACIAKLRARMLQQQAGLGV